MTIRRARTCRACRGRGDHLQAPHQALSRWVTRHQRLTTERARVCRAHEEGRASRDQVSNAARAVDRHRLAAPTGLCEDCAGAGRLPRRRRTTVRRRKR